MDMKQDRDQLVAWMRRQGVRRLRLNPDGHVDVELVWPWADAEGEQGQRVAPVPQVFADTDGAGVCSCGHSWVEHTVQGCLHGCSHEVCVSNATVDPGP